MMTRHELMDPAKKCSALTHIAESQVLWQNGGFEFGAYGRMRQQGLDLGRECKEITVPKIVERLNAEPVAHAKELFPIFVP